MKAGGGGDLGSEAPPAAEPALGQPGGHRASDSAGCRVCLHQGHEGGDHGKPRGVRLNGMPPYEIRMDTSLSSKFNEAAYTDRLQRQGTAEILRGMQLSQGPPEARPMTVREIQDNLLRRMAAAARPVVSRQERAIRKNPRLAPVALRREVLQTKELLSRRRGPEGSGRAGGPVPAQKEYAKRA